jgi:hypothetical protein
VRFNGFAPLAFAEEPKTVWLPEKSKSAYSVRCVFPAKAFKSGINVVDLQPVPGVILRAGEMELVKGEKPCVE